MGSVSLGENSAKKLSVFTRKGGIAQFKTAQRENSKFHGPGLEGELTEKIQCRFKKKIPTLRPVERKRLVGKTTFKRWGGGEFKMGGTRKTGTKNAARGGARDFSCADPENQT